MANGIGDHQVEAVDVGGGLTGHVRTLSVREMFAFRGAMERIPRDDFRNARAAELLVAAAACDTDGNRLLAGPTDDNAIDPVGDLLAAAVPVARWPLNHTARLFAKAAALNGIAADGQVD
jgi:hypothetical protein